MSHKTRKEVLLRLQCSYKRAGTKYKSRLVDQVVELFGYHRKAALRALKNKPRKKENDFQVCIIGRPKEYQREALLPVLKKIWFAAFQPCGRRLAALLPEWVPAYEMEYKKIDEGIKESLLGASARTLERLIAPLRLAACKRNGGTRPGSLLRQSIPIRGHWDEQGPGWLEVDTVAMCGGTLDDRHLWMLDAVDIRSDWTEQRALENRGADSVVGQIRDLEANLPFPLLGIDSDNGGEFLNHHLVRYLQMRPRPVYFTRSRPYHKNDNAHVEQRNWTHVRQHFGYERYDNPEVALLINALCKGALGMLQNHFLPTQKLVGKRREANRTIRIYGTAQTPYSRLLGYAEVNLEQKGELQRVHQMLNPLALVRQIEKEKKQIERLRLIIP